VNVHAVVPVKSLDHGKRRLAGALPGDERRRLIEAMLDDVLSTLNAVSSITAVSVLTDARSLVPQGCAHIEDPGLGLNAALSRAARMVAAAGASTMLILPADLPFVTVEDIQALIDATSDNAIVLAPDTEGTGTNALLISPPALLEPHFGVSSSAAHIASARALGAQVRVLHRHGLARDIDEPQHLQTLIEARSPRYAFLAGALRQAS
jgi:2-phospho-L-lactate guanylyltransferase